MPKLIAAFLAATCVVFAGQMPADAHASLVSTDPADGSQIPTAPRTVGLTFSEDLDSGFVAVNAPDGTKVRTSEPRISSTQMSADLAESHQRGTFTVAYRVVSKDGHPVAGEFTFTTTAGHQATPQEAVSQESFVDRNRTLLVVGLALAMVAIALMLAPLNRRRREA
ncbi:MAG: copper resistance CopC family protein [Aeromicrobium sp.]